MNDNTHAEKLDDARIDIARLEVMVEHLTKNMVTLQEGMREVQTTLSEAKGGWKTLMIVGGAAGIIGSAATWIVSHISK